MPTIHIGRPSRLLTPLTIALALCTLHCGPDNNGTTPDQDMTPADLGSDAGERDMGEDAAEDLPDADISPDEGTPDSDMDIPLPDGLYIAGLTEEVQTSFDAQHVLHLRCKTNEDCYAAQGYYHAAHRFAQMDLRRRVGSGRISSLLLVDNDDALESDISNRHIFTTRDGEPLEDFVYAQLGAKEKAAIDAYTRGVNAWLRDLEEKKNNARLSEEAEYPLIDVREIPPWRPEDSIMVGLVFLNNLMGIADSELGAAAALDRYGEDLFMDFYQGWHLDPQSSIITSAGSSYEALGANAFTNLPASPQLTTIKQRLHQSQDALQLAREQLAPALRYAEAHNPIGSNSWATGPELNQADHAILANDPHLSLSNPALWYLVEMNATEGDATGSLHAAGVSFPGMPGVLIGYSEDVAWSATVAYWDLVDVYVEELSADKQGIVRDGETIPFIKKTYTFERASGEVTRELLFVPGHGPVTAMGNTTAVTLKSVIADSREDFKLFLGLGETTSLAEAKTLLSGSTAAGFNFTLIDRQGNIAYYPFAGIPRREWDTSVNPPWLPLPGDGSAEWSETLIKSNELPQLYNPPNHFIATANAAITDDMLDGIPGNAGYPPLQTPFMAPGARQARIVDLLQASNAHTAEEFLAMQGDTTSWLAQELLPDILAAVDPQNLSQDEAALYTTLSGWDYTCPTGLVDPRDPEGSAVDEATRESAAGCAAFHVLLFSMTYAIFKDNVVEKGGTVTPSYEIRSLYWLFKDPSILNTSAELYWDDRATTDVVETRTDTLLATFSAATAHLDTLFDSSSPQDWIWGRIHTLTMVADLLSTITPQFNHGPFATPGGLYTINVANPSSPREGDGNYGHGSGASMRMVVEGKPEGFVGHFNFPGGQVHRRDSEFYDHLLDGWLTNTHFIMPFTPEEVDAQSVTTTKVLPDEG